jgi:hypothetical protein
MQNTKLYLEDEYSKMSGFVAYSYLAYNKEIESLKQKEELAPGQSQSWKQICIISST